MTGGTGFIGSRLCERLTLDYKLPYRVLVRTFTHAPRIARLGADMIGGDLDDPDAMDKALVFVAKAPMCAGTPLPNGNGHTTREASRGESDA